MCASSNSPETSATADDPALPAQRATTPALDDAARLTMSICWAAAALGTPAASRETAARPRRPAPPVRRRRGPSRRAPHGPARISAPVYEEKCAGQCRPASGRHQAADERRPADSRRRRVRDHRGPVVPGYSQSPLARPQDGFRPVGDLELGEHVGEMVAHRLGSQAESLGDDGRTQAGGEQVQDAALALSQLREGLRGRGAGAAK